MIALRIKPIAVLLAIGLLALAGCRPSPVNAPTAEPSPEVDAAIHELFDPIGQYDCFRSIAWRESRYSPTAVGGGQYLGLFQIRRSSGVWANESANKGWPLDPFNARDNAIAARAMFDVSGISPWGRC